MKTKIPALERIADFITTDIIGVLHPTSSSFVNFYFQAFFPCREELFSL